ncbi:hypothetical protein M2317_000819 [Microbacterium sp. ZKA21]|uniref:hypothetical protein n=1 Tax=Microbacterium sp. ZKA21 TaxID=3381694 RepID=UPI003D1B02EC
MGGDQTTVASRERTAREERALELANAIQTLQSTAPSAQKPAADWVREFRAFGFFRATQIGAVLAGTARNLQLVSFADTRPREAAMIFRVSAPDGQHRVSWTPLVSAALKYAPGGENSGHVKHDDARLFSAVVEPDDVLAVLNDYEWIVDTARLTDVRDHGPIVATLPVSVVSDLPDSPGKALAMKLLGPGALVKIIGEPYRLDLPMDGTLRRAA